MDSEIERLNGLRDFFIERKRQCEAAIRVQQTKIEAWTECVDQIDRALADCKRANDKPQTLEQRIYEKTS